VSPYIFGTVIVVLAVLLVGAWSRGNKWRDEADLAYSKYHELCNRLVIGFEMERDGSDGSRVLQEVLHEALDEIRPERDDPHDE
jgi:hypothetical protein